MKAVLYVKKVKPYLYKTKDTTYPAYPIGYHMDKDLKVKLSNTNELAYLNGKIVAECDFEIEDIVYKHIHERDQFGRLNNGAWYEYKGLNVSHYECGLSSRSGFEDSSSLFDYLFDYLDSKNGKAIHIKNLHIFDSPIFLEGFDDNKGHTLRKAPHNMCKILRANIGDYNYKDLNSNAYEPYILIPISSQEACNLLNRKQDVLIRRNVLKEMKY